MLKSFLSHSFVLVHPPSGLKEKTGHILASFFHKGSCLGVLFNKPPFRFKNFREERITFLLWVCDLFFGCQEFVNNETDLMMIGVSGSPFFGSDIKLNERSVLFLFCTTKYFAVAAKTRVLCSHSNDSAGQELSCLFLCYSFDCTSDEDTKCSSWKKIKTFKWAYL